MTSLVDAAEPQPAAGQAPVMPVSDEPGEGIVSLRGELSLHFGGRLSGVQVAWRMAGPIGAPVVVALGGISAGRRVTSEGGVHGWWSNIVGLGRALDSAQYQILGMDFLGGSGATTGPRDGQIDFPSVSAYDQAELLRRVMGHLRIARVHAIVGASYGGMVALAFAERWPDLVGSIVSISAADRSHPMATAWRSVQRAVVRYALGKGDGHEGLRLARALAMATYRSPDEFDQRFSGPPIEHVGRDNGGRFTFPVESYLMARGEAYAASYRPEAFVCLSESIDLHKVDAAKVRVPTTLIAVREDQLVPLQDMRALRERLSAPAELFEISSRYGHDAFLKEDKSLGSIFARVLHPASEAL